MSIRETIELEVTGRSELRSVAGELDRIAKGLKAINSAKDPRAALEGKLALQREKNAGRIAAIEKKSAADIAKARVSGEEKRRTAKAAVDERIRAKAVQKRATAEGRAAKYQQRGADAASVAKGSVMATAVEMGARAALDLVVAGGRALYQAQAFREDVRGGLELILRSKTEADRVMSRAAQTADFIGRGRAETSGAMLDFLTKGFTQDKSDEIVKRLADLSAVDPRANLEGVQRAIGQIAGKGRLQGDELLQLAEAGLETSSVYEALGKALKKSRAEIVKMQAAGKISSEVAVQAILDAISQQTGGKGAGEVAREKSMRDLSGLMKRIESIPGNVFFDLQVGPGVDGVKGAMRDIIEFFDASSASGKEVRKVLGDTINALVEGFTGIDPSKGTSIKDTLAALVDIIKGNKDQIREFAAGVAAMGKAFAWVAGVTASIYGAKKAIDDFMGFKPPTALWIFSTVLLAGPRAALAALQALFPSFYAAGSQIISGLVSGITAGASAVITAITNTVKSGISAAKTALGIASPSKVFAEMGAMVPLGMGVGITRTTGRAEAAAADMANRVIGGASGFSGPANANAAGASPVAQGAATRIAAAAPGGQVVVQVTIESIVIGAGAPEDGADRFVARLVEALPAALAQVA